MRIDELLWPRERIEHIARHGVTPMKSSKCVSVNHWCNEQSPMATTRFIMFLAKQTRGAIYFQWSFSFQTAKDTQSRRDPWTDKEERRYRKWRDK